MKNSLLNNQMENEPVVMEWFEREKVISAFNRMRFKPDYKARFVIILRNSDFPFQRIALPTQKSIHIELLKLYAKDLDISLPKLVRRLQLKMGQELS